MVLRVMSTKTVDANEFRLIVPGDKVVCAMEQTDYTERGYSGNEG